MLRSSTPGLLLLLATLLAGNVHAQEAETPMHSKSELVAPTPPMGWNSWDAYGLTIDEAQFRANVAVQAKVLKPFGWTYSVIDEGWFLRNPEQRPHPELLAYELDRNGRYVPVPARFPSALTSVGANTGFAALSSWVHAQGLKFGIHIVRGIPRASVKANLPIEGSAFHAADAADTSDACPWDPTNWGVKPDAAGQAWYDALLHQYAAWGVDFLKVDCISDHPYKPSEIRQIHLAIERSGRPIVLSLSPGPTAISHAAEVQSLAQMWRISDDIWDVWSTQNAFPRTVREQFELAAQWAPYAGPGSWPDSDMLPFGALRPSPGGGPGARSTRLTPVEQRTMLTLWSMARSPLILGANLTLLDPATIALITDRDLLRIDQHASTSAQVLHEGDLIAWKAELPRNLHAIALFNVGDSPLAVDRSFSDFGLPGDAYRTKESGQRRTVTARSVQQTIAPHGSVLFFLSR